MRELEDRICKCGHKESEHHKNIFGGVACYHKLLINDCLCMCTDFKVSKKKTRRKNGKEN